MGGSKVLVHATAFKTGEMAKIAKETKKAAGLVKTPKTPVELGEMLSKQAGSSKATDAATVVKVAGSPKATDSATVVMVRDRQMFTPGAVPTAVYPPLREVPIQHEKLNKLGQLRKNLDDTEAFYKTLIQKAERNGGKVQVGTRPGYDLKAAQAEAAAARKKVLEEGGSYADADNAARDAFNKVKENTKEEFPIYMTVDELMREQKAAIEPLRKEYSDLRENLVIQENKNSWMKSGNELEEGVVFDNNYFYDKAKNNLADELNRAGYQKEADFIRRLEPNGTSGPDGFMFFNDNIDFAKMASGILNPQKMNNEELTRLIEMIRGVSKDSNYSSFFR